MKYFIRGKFYWKFGEFGAPAALTKSNFVKITEIYPYY